MSFNGDLVFLCLSTKPSKLKSKTNPNNPRPTVKLIGCLIINENKTTNIIPILRDAPQKLITVLRLFQMGTVLI